MKYKALFALLLANASAVSLVQRHIDFQDLLEEDDSAEVNRKARQSLMESQQSSIQQTQKLFETNQGILATASGNVQQGTMGRSLASDKLKAIKTNMGQISKNLQTQMQNIKGEIDMSHQEVKPDLSQADKDIAQLNQFTDKVIEHANAVAEIQKALADDSLGNGPPPTAPEDKELSATVEGAKKALADSK